MLKERRSILASYGRGCPPIREKSACSAFIGGQFHASGCPWLRNAIHMEVFVAEVDAIPAWAI
jgi:hypothetical protein